MRATGHATEMVALMQELLAVGHAYVAGDESGIVGIAATAVDLDLVAAAVTDEAARGHVDHGHSVKRPHPFIT